MTLQTKLIFSLQYLLLLSCIHSLELRDVEGDKLIAELQLDDLELIDICEDLASAQKTAFLTNDYSNKIGQEQYYAKVLKTHYNVLRQVTVVPTDLERNWTYQVKPGDALLPEDKWNKLVLYQNYIEELKSRYKFICLDQSCQISKGDYKNNEKTVETLRKTWTNWQNSFYNTSDKEFRNNLGLLKEAATLNEFETVKEYWEALLDFQGAYEQADVFWGEISPFYKKLQMFVKKRLLKFYNVQNTTHEIPAYLFDDGLPNDWSNIAAIILPHPQLHYDVESYLKFKDVKGIYSYAENVASRLGFGPLGEKFWKNSNFNYSYCEPQLPKLFEFCGQEYTEIVECNKTSWPVYLNSHEAALKISLSNFDYASLPRQQLRYCALDDAVETLGSLLAIESLEDHGIAKTNVNSADDDTVEMTKLLLTALRVMPSLAYSLMVDKWRIDLIEQNSTDSAQSWWKFRKEYTGVQGIVNEENEYMGDSRVLYNKPYISKFFGTLVAFQLFSFYKERAEKPQHIVADFKQDDAFMTMLKARHSTDWPYLLTIHYGLDLGTAELLKYFEPLEKYFETAPSEQVALVTTTSSTTTSTTTTSTTKAPPSSKLEVSLDSEVVNDQPKPNIGLNTGTVGDKAANPGVTDSHVAMYVGVGGLILVGCLLGVAFVYKKLRRKPLPNNRRFDT